MGSEENANLPAYILLDKYYILYYRHYTRLLVVSRTDSHTERLIQRGKSEFADSGFLSCMPENIPHGRVLLFTFLNYNVKYSSCFTFPCFSALHRLCFPVFSFSFSLFTWFCFVNCNNIGSNPPRFLFLNKRMSMVE